MTRASARSGLVEELARLAAEAVADHRVHSESSGNSRSGDGERGERRVAERAARRHLGALAAQHLAAGEEPLSGHDERTVLTEALDEALGLGRLQQLLDDDDITDIHIRGREPVWVKRRDGGRERLRSIVDDDGELIELIRHVATRATAIEHRFDAAHPEVNLRLPDGSRLFAVMDVSARPAMVIRRHRFELSSLSELAARGMVSEELAEFFTALVRSRRNLVIAGGTGSGKTTLLRALINEIPVTERIVTIEDSFELGLDRFADLHPDHDMLQARVANIEGRGEVTLFDLTRMALRMDPDRVIVGEVRGGEAFALLLAMSQGNSSMCTMHADSTRTVLSKLAAYSALAGTGVPTDVVNQLLASSVHFVAHVDLRQGRRMVSSVREVVGVDSGTIVTNEVWTPGPDGSAVPGYPVRESTWELLASHGAVLEHVW